MNHFIFDCRISKDEANSVNAEDIVNDRFRKISENLIQDEVILIPYFKGKIEDVGISIVGILRNGGHMTFHSFSNRMCYYFDYYGTEEFDHVKAKVMECFPYIENKSNIRILQKDDAVEKYISRIHFGPHVIYKLRTEAFNEDYIKDILNDLPDKIKMHKISDVCVYKNNKYIDGIVVIAESHISVHYNTVDQSAYIDIFSCKPFNIKTSNEYLKEKGIINDIRVYARYNRDDLSDNVKNYNIISKKELV